MRVLVLGASTGIGRAVARKFAAEGHQLLLAGRDTEELARVACDIRIRWGVQADIKAFEALEAARHPAFFQECLQMLTEIDGVVLAYGYLGDEVRARVDFSEAARVMALNYTTCVSILHEAATYMEGRGGGFLCALSSVAGDRGRQSNYVYGSAKGGLSIFLQGLRNRLHPAGVQVITVKPGFVDTPMTYGKKGMFLVASAEKVADGIYRTVVRKKDVVYLPFFWRPVMMLIRALPERVFKRMKL